MKHRMVIRVSRDPPEMHLAHCKKIPVRERFLRWAFGKKRPLTVIVPGDTVETISIEEVPKGGSAGERTNDAGQG